MRPHDWAFFTAIGAVVLTVAAILRGDVAWALGWAALAAGAAWAARSWSRRYPGPMPHRLRWLLLLPRGNHSPRHLQRILEPRSGERILEIGPGIGVHALPVASALSQGGILDVLDVQAPMLDDLQERARKAGIANIASKVGDATKLPYPDATFDGAYLMTVLGEIPDEGTTLVELRRVLKSHGRLIIGELFMDPDFISLSSLKDKARRAGFAFERKHGSPLSYLARFRPA